MVPKNAVLLPPLLREVSSVNLLQGQPNKSQNGAVVQLVRIPACHAVGREFESRPHRKKTSEKVSFCFILETANTISFSREFESRPHFKKDIIISNLTHTFHYESFLG